MSDLAQRNCVPCRGGVLPLTADEIGPLQMQVADWKVVNDHHLVREFGFVNFAAALAFIERVGAMAEEQRHHPDIRLSWGKARVEIWTHKIDGLTESDFIFAAKTNEIWMKVDGLKD